MSSCRHHFNAFLSVGQFSLTADTSFLKIKITTLSRILKNYGIIHRKNKRKQKEMFSLCPLIYPRQTADPGRASRPRQWQSAEYLSPTFKTMAIDGDLIKAGAT